MKWQDQNARIFHGVLVGIFIALLLFFLSDSVQTDHLLCVSMLLAGCAYNWITGFWSLLQSLSFASLVLGFALWVTAPDGERAPWWGVVLMLGFRAGSGARRWGFDPEA